MRIGIDAHMLGDYSGGNESFYEGILKAFEPDEENEYILFMNEAVDDTPYKDRFNVVRFRSNNAFVRNFVELTRLCRKYKLDVLHTQYYIPFIRLCPVVCTIHDISFEHYTDIFTRGEYIRNKILVPYSARKCSRIVTVSNFCRDDIADRYNILKEKISVVYNAVSSDFRKLSDEELKHLNIRKRFGIGEADYLLCVGNLQPRKNIPRLIQAFEQYCDRAGSNTKLILVGKRAWMFDDILKSAERLQDRIIFTDYVEQESLIALINEAKAFVYPSFFEGFGIPPLEALACETPVAVSDIPVLRETLGDNAVYFNPYDVLDISKGIERVLTEGTHKEYNCVMDFSWRHSADVLRKVYKTVADKDSKND